LKDAGICFLNDDAFAFALMELIESFLILVFLFCCLVLVWIQYIWRIPDCRRHSLIYRGKKTKKHLRIEVNFIEKKKKVKQQLVREENIHVRIIRCSQFCLLLQIS